MTEAAGLAGIPERGDDRTMLTEDEPPPVQSNAAVHAFYQGARSARGMLVEQLPSHAAVVVETRMSGFTACPLCSGGRGHRSWCPASVMHVMDRGSGRGQVVAEEWLRFGG